MHKQPWVFLHRLRVPFTKVMYDPADPEYAAKRDKLFQANGHANIFVGIVFVGGYHDLRTAHEMARLDGLLEAVGVYLDEL